MEDSERIEPDFFLGQFYYPADKATEKAVEALRIELGLQNRDSSREAVSGYLVACRGLLGREASLLGFPHDPKAFERGHATYTRMRETLVEKGYIELAQTGYVDFREGTNFVSTYEVLRFPDACQEPLRFDHRRPEHILRVRQHKAKYSQTTDHLDEGRLLTERECLTKFGQDYILEEMRLRRLADYLEQHPLVMMGLAYKGFSRKFNNASLKRGGRIYTGYSSLKKELINGETGEVTYPRQTATIDGEKVVLIDISASFLCIRAAMGGDVILPDRDPYGRLPFVVGDDKDPSRAFAKVLVSAMIANGGTKKRYTQEMREDFRAVIGNHKISHFTDAIYAAFPFLRAKEDGLLVMFLESNIMVRTMESCMAENIPVWPLHDAIFVRQSQAEMAQAILSEEFWKVLGFKPRLKVDNLV